MTKRIIKAQLNILEGILLGEMAFGPGLNILSGENGTLKTRVLQVLKNGPGVFVSDPADPPQIQAISPKRNSERRQFLSMIQQFRQQNRNLSTLMTERIGSQLQDGNFENYPSLAELYYLIFDDRCRDGGDRQAHMASVTDELNQVIQSIFPHYRLVANWDDSQGSPNIRMRKLDQTDLPIEGLSLGEQEILSLVASLHAAIPQIDVFLIDEPEVHLNWHLEQRLFEFLDRLCADHQKQVIVVTHSRTIFQAQFLPKVQFLYWTDDGHVAWGQELRADLRKRIAGDAISVLHIGDLTRPTFFVEDAAHQEVLEALAGVMGVEVSIQPCSGSPNVRSLFRYSESEGGWQNCYFLTDGDNEGNPHPGKSSFIHLDKYCIENYLLSPPTAAVIVGRTENEVASDIVEVIKAKRMVILRKNRFFDFLVDQLGPADIDFERLGALDASLILEPLLDRWGVQRSTYVDAYVRRLADDGALTQVFPQELVDAVAATGVALP